MMLLVARLRHFVSCTTGLYIDLPVNIDIAHEYTNCEYDASISVISLMHPLCDNDDQAFPINATVV